MFTLPAIPFPFCSVACFTFIREFDVSAAVNCFNDSGFGSFVTECMFLLCSWQDPRHADHDRGTDFTDWLQLNQRLNSEVCLATRSPVKSAGSTGFTGTYAACFF